MSAVQVLYSIGVRFGGGGIGNIAYHGASGLHRHGMLQRLLCGSYRETTIPVHRISALGPLSRLLRRLALYEKGGGRILYLHNTLYDRWAQRQLEPCDIYLNWNGFGRQALRRARAAGARTVVYRASSHPATQSCLLQEEYNRWGRRYVHSARQLERALSELQVADFIVIPSDFVRQSFLEQGVEAHRLVQIPFGVDSERFYPADDPSPEDPYRVIYAGQIGIRKGVPYLLEAWAQLGWTAAELWLVGRVQGEFEPLLRPYRDLPGLRLPGHVDDLASLFRQSHLFVFPTVEEGSALVTYEAMASGLAVITTPNAGSLIRNGQDGVVVPFRDVQALAKQMELLRGDVDRRRQLGKAARRRIEPYTWARYGDSLAEALVEIGAGSA